MIDNMVFLQKLKRKIEGDLKLTQEAVGDLERIKADLNAALQRKEKEAQSMGAKIEEELLVQLLHPAGQLLHLLPILAAQG